MNAVFTTGHRRTAVRLVVFAALLATLAFAPGAMAVDEPGDPVAVDASVTIDVAVAAATTPTDATVVAPAPAPVEPPPVVTEPVVAPPLEPPAPRPDPVAGAGLAPVPAVQPTPDMGPLAVTEPTPAAPQELIVVPDTPVVPAASEVAIVATVGPDSGPVAPTGGQVDQDTPATPLIVAPLSQSAATDPSTIAALVAPIVQTLGSGLLSPYERPQTFGIQLADAGAVAGDAGANPLPPTAHRPAQATHVAADLPFGFAAPSGGWSGEGAGILALLMGFLPLGLPDGKSSLTQETQTALILMGALLIVLPFFACPIRDRRRRGPRGFATLALRPG